MGIKLGLVKPGASAGRENVTFWRTHAPEGVEIMAADLRYGRPDRETFERGWHRAEILARELAGRGCDLIVISGTPPFLIRGRVFEDQWRVRLSSRMGIPIVTAMESHARALRFLEEKTVAVATYYGDELNEAIRKYLADFGIEAIALGGFSLTGQSEALFSTPMRIQASITSQQVYDYCYRRVRQHARVMDALYINGAGWDVAPTITKLEQDLGVAVVWGPVAEMWQSYRVLGISNPQSDCGRLLIAGMEGRRELHRPIRRRMSD
jgi:maleate cis-trans isomerase